MLDNYQQRDVKSYKAAPLPDPIPVVGGEVNDIGYDNPPDHHPFESRGESNNMGKPDESSVENQGQCQLGDYAVDPDDDTKVILIFGWLLAPNKSEFIQPDSMTIIAGSKVWIKCPWTATLNDGVLEAGGELGAPVVEGGANMPDNVIPDVTSLTGTYYIPLGAWDDDEVWTNEGCGSITVSFCPRVFSFTRGGRL
tara:strand:- start:26304 stop:26891 length:588 start_codon:yes stop_codon:yes gene_type:complete